MALTKVSPEILDLNNTAGTSNLRLGVNAGNSIVSGGNYNVLVGDEAGTAITTGDKNIALGYGALDAVTTSEGNVGIGHNAGGGITTGTNNTAVGTNALDSTTTASNNTAVGKSALTANTTGTRNVAVGSSALDANTTANDNTAVGHSALGLNVSGTRNTALGAYALDTSTGHDNTALGRAAMDVNTSGGSNTAVGSSALGANTTASNNTAVGYVSLGANTTGGGNCGLGYRAGYTTTTGGNNVYIGQYAGAHNVLNTTGEKNTLVGALSDTTLVGTSGANVLGYNVSGAAGYTTLGSGTSDIRAEHGVDEWNTVSDERLKKDITDSTAGLAFVNALRPVTWKYKTLGELPETFNAYEADSTEVFKNTQTNHGFIAQEVKAAIDADGGIKDGFRMWAERDDGCQEVGKTALIPVLVKAIQEQSALITSLTARVAELEG